MRTLPELFEAGLARPRERHLLWRAAPGDWRALSTAQVRLHVERLSRALAAFGLRPGDRVGLLSRNSPRWALADFALQSAGLVNVPLYPTLAPEQVRFIVDDCAARFLLVEDVAQWQRLAEGLAGSSLEGVALLSDEDPPEGVRGWLRLLDEGQAAPAHGVVPGPEDLASIIYTSGTTGRPKGAMLTHANLVANARQCAAAIDLTKQPHVNLSLLPLSHIFQRLVDYLLFQSGATMAYAANPLEAIDHMAEVRPTFFASVPRLFEKVKAGFEARVAASPVRARLARWALAVGRRHFDAWYRDGDCDGRPGLALRLEHAAADALVLSKVRAVFGGRVAICFSGGAPLPSEVHAFYRTVGLNILPGYGLTEASPVLCTNREQRMKLASVGPALPELELRVAEDGELLARGPNVMKGYWNLADETAEALSDGWLHTGDLARVDERGYVFITGRKKELLVLSTGKKVAPQLVEDRLTRSPLVAQVMLLGDGEKYVSALVHPDLARLAAAAKEAGIAAAGPDDLLADERVEKLVLDDLHARCEGLAEFEKPKKIAFLPKELSMADGELTPTLKLRRKVILDRQSALVARLYAGAGDRS